MKENMAWVCKTCKYELLESMSYCLKSKDLCSKFMHKDQIVFIDEPHLEWENLQLWNILIKYYHHNWWNILIKYYYHNWVG